MIGSGFRLSTLVLCLCDSDQALSNTDHVEQWDSVHPYLVCSPMMTLIYSCVSNEVPLAGTMIFISNLLSEDCKLAVHLSTLAAHQHCSN